MIRSVEIRHFRCFENARIENCCPVNVLVGQNGSGKTTFLEALFLAAARSPEIALRLRQWRGFETTFSGEQEHIEQAIWGDFFHNFDTNKPVSIELTGDNLHSRSLFISYRDRSEVLIPLDKGLSTTAPITFQWKGPSYEFSDTPKIVGGQLQFEQLPTSPIDGFFFAANRTYSAAEMATRFSQLSKSFAHEEVVSRIRNLFPNIRDLSIEMFAGSAMVYASIDRFSHKIPLNLISGGINKFVHMMFTIASHPRCILLVDEIENGMYHEKMKDIWSSLLEFTKAYNAQIFATTHSGECLNAVMEAAEHCPDDVDVIRAELVNDLAQLRLFHGSSAFSGIRMGEIR